MTRTRRIAITACVVLVAGIGLVAARTMMMAGMFDEVKPLPRACKTLTDVTGVEDIAIDTKGGLVFLSATDRRAIAQGKPSKADGIYTASLAHPEAGFTRLAGAPEIFHPHGISLFRAADGSLTLMAVNHLTADHSAVDIFDVAKTAGGVRLNETGDIQGDKLIHPNDVAAVGKEQFYVTNDHGSRTEVGMTLENYLTLPRANVLYFDGTMFREAATGLVFANGINVSPDGNHIYVAESTARRVQTFRRDAFSGKLTPENAFAFPSGPDNIDVSDEGDLWIAGHPKMFGLVAYASDPTKPSPTEIFHVRVSGGIPQSAEPVYVNSGREIGAGSVGATAGKNLFIGSIFDPKILECALP
jgi:arylesterase / paraoxonase